MQEKQTHITKRGLYIVRQVRLKPMQDEDADERTLLITSRFPFTSRLPELISLAERESSYLVEDYTISIA